MTKAILGMLRQKRQAYGPNACEKEDTLPTAAEVAASRPVPSPDFEGGRLT